MNLKFIILCEIQGIGKRGCSIRVGRETEKNGKGESQSPTIIPSMTRNFLVIVNIQSSNAGPPR